MKENAIVMISFLTVAAVAWPGLSSGQIGFNSDQSLDPKEALAKARDSAPPVSPRAIVASYALESASSKSEPGGDIEWITIHGRRFTQGSGEIFEDEKPIHEVTIETFEMSKTLVTVEQYRKCVMQGACSVPHSTQGLISEQAVEEKKYCTWWQPDRERHPVNCVTWDQAKQYAKFMDARLPTESEYEYAAKSQGKAKMYPWGNQAPTCATTVMSGSGPNCSDSDHITMPVCTKSAGNTAQGLCDMTGNVAEWMQDTYVDSYANTPVDGSAFEGQGDWRVTRGGSWSDYQAVVFRTEYRGRDIADLSDPRIGFRLARSLPDTESQ